VVRRTSLKAVANKVSVKCTLRCCFMLPGTLSLGVQQQAAAPFKLWQCDLAVTVAVYIQKCGPNTPHGFAPEQNNQANEKDKDHARHDRAGQRSFCFGCSARSRGRLFCSVAAAVLAV